MAAVITTGLFLGAASATFGGASDTLVLSGTLPAVADIEITPEANIDNLPLANLVVDRLVATVTEKCNSATGYTVSLASANATGDNAGNLVLLKGAVPFAYTLKYGTHTVDLTDDTDAAVASENDVTPLLGTERNITISWAVQELAAGTYTDTLTLTIAAK